MSNPDYKKSLQQAKDILSTYNIFSPPIPVIEIAEGEGLSISSTSMDDLNSNGKIACAALILSSKAILVEKNDSIQRKRFSVAHEIGHYLMHHAQLERNPDLGIIYRAPIERETDPLEQEANFFAAHLLVPTEMLKYWHSITQSQQELATIFSVSMEVIGWRLKNERIFKVL